MTDVHSPEIRSKNMRAIRGRDTGPEVFIRKALYKAGFRYRISPAGLPGKPDMYFPRYKAVIFVHCCFWHAHGCYLFKMPQNRHDFWIKKLSCNIDRDTRNMRLLLDKGYRVLVIWECAIKGRLRLQSLQLIEGIEHWLKSDSETQTVDYRGFHVRSGQTDANQYFK